MALRAFAYMLSALFCVISFHASAANYDALYDYSFGTDALIYDHSNTLSLQLDTVLIDGEVKTQPVNSTNRDRTATTFMRVMGTTPLSPRFGSRYSLFLKGDYRKQEGEQEPRKIVTENTSEGYGRLEMVFFTQSRLEVFFGVTYEGRSGFTRKTESPSVETTWKFSPASMPIPHIGIVKRTGFLSGGFFYKQGAEASRDVEKTTSQDDSKLTFRDTIHNPTATGIFVRLSLGPGVVTGEFSAIQGSEGGNKTDEGATLTEDYTKARLIYLQHLQNIALKASLIHRTLSYSENLTVSLDTIPMTALHLKARVGGDRNHFFAGIIYAYGKDGQSITEFNADYKVQAYGANLGFFLGL